MRPGGSSHVGEVELHAWLEGIPQVQCRVPNTVLELHREKIAVEPKISPEEIYPYGFQGHKGMIQVQAVEAGNDSLISMRGRVSCRYVLEECCVFADPQEKNNVA